MPDYYGILKVPQGASLEEIQRSFRKLAHLYHPDKPGGSVTNFIAITQAHETLSDPGKRSAYDASLKQGSAPVTNNPPSAPAYDPTRCQGCGERVPLKQVRLYQNIGMLFARKSKTIDGKLCKNCIDAYFWRFTLTTFFLGWWGIISFFTSIGYLLNNLYVFLTSRTLKKSHARGRERLYAWGVMLFVIAASIFFIALAVNDNTDQPASSSDDGYVPSVSSAPLVENTQAAAAIVPTPAAKDPQTYVSLANGTILGKKATSLKGLGQLHIENGTDSDAIAKLVDTETNKSIYSVYIRANGQLDIKHISDGTYKLLFNLGKDWNTTQKTFELNGSYEAFDDDFDFTTIPHSDYDQYTKYNVTLNPVLNGQAETEHVDPKKFDDY